MNQITPTVEIPIQDKEKDYLKKCECTFEVVSDEVGGAKDWDLIALPGSTQNLIAFQTGDRIFFKEEYIIKKK